jgi:hypothetical protein
LTTLPIFGGAKTVGSGFFTSTIGFFTSTALATGVGFFTSAALATTGLGFTSFAALEPQNGLKDSFLTSATGFFTSTIGFFTSTTGFFTSSTGFFTSTTGFFTSAMTGLGASIFLTCDCFCLENRESIKSGIDLDSKGETGVPILSRTP